MSGVTCPRVTFVPLGEGRWRAFLLGVWLGDVLRGEASAYFRTPSGRGALYGSVSELEQAVWRAASYAAERRVA